MEIKNLKKAAGRIKKAILEKERIILYGDSDLDGITSVIVIKEAIGNMGGEVTAVYFPDREREGYGISKTGLAFFKKKKLAPALLIAFDCGIGNFKEVKLAKKMGFEVIIVDHHEVLDKLPSAEIIVDPKQKGEKYSFKKFAAAGLAFKLAEALLADKMAEGLRNNFLELVAMATIADMMPEEKENEIFISEGLKSLENSWRPGLRALLSSPFLSECQNLKQKVSKIISILNVRDAGNKTPVSFRLFVSSSIGEAAAVMEGLFEKGEERKRRVNEITASVESRISGKEDVIFEGDSDWEYPLVSTAASILLQKYQKPVFIFKKLGKDCLGSVRMPKNTDSISLMKKCRKYLITYGGHPQAAGFRVKNKNLKKFKLCLIKNLREK